VIYDFALEPELVATWWDPKVWYPVRSQMGLGTRRVPCIFPSASWKKLVMGALQKSIPEEEMARWQSARKKMDILLQHLHQNAARRSGRCAETESWLDAAVREHEEFPFGGILVGTTGLVHTHVVAVDKLADDEHPAWSPPAPPVVRQALQLAAALAPLLRSAHELRFVDPYFDADDPTFFEPMKAYLEVAQKRRTVGDLRIQIHFTIGSQQVAQQSRIERTLLNDETVARERLASAERKLSPVLDRRVAARVFAWGRDASGQGMHNRYVLSDLGGVAVQTGLDQDSRGSRRTDDLTVLSKEQYGARWAEFAPEGTTYRRLGEHKFSGAVGDDA